MYRRMHAPAQATVATMEVEIKEKKHGKKQIQIVFCSWKIAHM